MKYIVRETELFDLDYLPLIEKSAGNAFISMPNLAWIADNSVMSRDEHERLLTLGFSWVAFEEISQNVAGFLTAEIIENDFYIGEISVSENHQQQGIGSKLFDTALVKAKSMDVTTATLTTFIDVPWNAPYYERLGFVVLKEKTLPLYLQIKLQEEINAGFPIERRCAMSKTL